MAELSQGSIAQEVALLLLYCTVVQGGNFWDTYSCTMLEFNATYQPTRSPLIVLINSLIVDCGWAYGLYFASALLIELPPCTIVDTCCNAEAALLVL